MQRNRKLSRGLTLVELMVTVAVLAILAGIAYPAYTNYTYKARRTEATGTLVDFATRMERYYADNNSYTGATTNTIMGDTTTEHGYYTLGSTQGNGNQTYTLTAAPAAQSEDACGTFSLSSQGARTVSGSGTCW